MTFNIRTDAASDGLNNWKYRYHKVAKLMENYGASVIGTQEGRISMLGDLEKELSSSNGLERDEWTREAMSIAPLL